ELTEHGHGLGRRTDLCAWRERGEVDRVTVGAEHPQVDPEVVARIRDEVDTRWESTYLSRHDTLPASVGIELVLAATRERSLAGGPCGAVPVALLCIGGDDVLARGPRRCRRGGHGAQCRTVGWHGCPGWGVRA